MNVIQKIRRYRTVISNYSYLSVLQVINILLPLITYPYLIKVLGKDIFGLVVFAQAVIGYFQIFVGFGFNISATRVISIHRDNNEKLNEITSSVLILKAVLFVISLVLLWILLFFIKEAKGYEILFILTMWICLYDLIFPIWYFQGTEQMKYITLITLVSKLVFVGLIFIFIHHPSDYLMVAVINGIGAVLAGIISLYIIFIRHRIRFQWQSLSTLRYYLCDSAPIFISNLSSKIYVSTNKVIAGAFLSMADVAYYDLAEKVTTVFKLPQNVLSQTLFPKISKDKNPAFVKKIFHISLVVNIVLFVLILVFSKFIVLILGGETMLNSVRVVNVLAVSIPVIAMSNVLGIQMLIPFGYSKIFRRVILVSGLFYFIQALILWGTSGFNILNISVITITTEIFVTAGMYYYCEKFGLWK